LNLHFIPNFLPIAKPVTVRSFHIDRGIDNLLQLDTVYEKGDIEKKREVISSMYPEKLTFDGFSLRTTRINEAVRLIYTLGVGLREIKKDKMELIPHCPLKSGRQD